MNEITYTNLSSGIDSYLISNLIKENSSSDILIIARDDKRLSLIASSLKYYLADDDLILLPAWDCLPYDRVSPGSVITTKRIESLCKMASSGQRKIVITTINALIQKLPPKEIIKQNSIFLKKGDKVKRNELIESLINNGYVRSASANEPGEFALRGSIIDIYPGGGDFGYRLDFFGNQLEGVKKFDPLTQMSNGKAGEFALYPASEIIYDENKIELFRKKYRDCFGAITDNDPLYEAISDGRKYPGMEHWLPMFYEELDDVFAYLSSHIVISDHLINEAFRERIELIKDHYEVRKEHQNSKSDHSSYKPVPVNLLYISDVAELNNKLDKATQKINLTFFSDGNNQQKIDYQKIPDFFADSKMKKQSAILLLNDFIKTKAKKIAISCFSEGARERLKKMLEQYEIAYQLHESWYEFITSKTKSLSLIIMPLEKGYEFNDFVLISEQDVLGERISRNVGRKKRSENFLAEAASLNEGEIVVHKEHGIGQFVELETLLISGENHDCLKIKYDGGDILYVPVENIDILSRYGSDNENASLDKLGSANWQARKAKMKKRIQIAAEELLKIAAQREVKKAPSFESLKGLYDEFCARFPYVETDDQLRAIEDIQNDFLSGRPMDRLICGDVGYGKTEVALRAAFIAASNGVQVAVVAPTTLLARQHYKNFKERFAGMPIKILQLSRLVSQTNAAKVKKAMKEGKVDIVVGTHALLAKNIEFANLGLLVIDEEQQFGVAQKERLKQVRSDIHVLSLSATPIPRTLQMSLSGIKDLSLIATPPIDRLSVRTFVMPYDSVIIRDAILREHYRGGKTFYVAPRIKDLDELEEGLKKLVPEVKLAKAHGQMAPADIDKIMNDFYDGLFDVLLSTNIVGSGLDINSANTIIVHRANMFGLGQLYQLRGRVGRGKIRAYSYFTIPAKGLPSENALKRLEVMQSLDSLGAGFSIASHDMDIRGFGNLIGEEQSGQIKEVGVELYQDMLKEEIAKIKAKQEDEVEELEDWSPQINLGIAVLIPENYVQDLTLRMGLYRRIGQLQSEDDIELMQVEMVDRFGQIPDELSNLFTIVSIKQKCKLLSVEKIDAGPKGISISFKDNKIASPEKLLEYINKNPAMIKLRPDQSVLFKGEFAKTDSRILATKNIINKLAEILV